MLKSTFLDCEGHATACVCTHQLLTRREEINAQQWLRGRGTKLPSKCSYLKESSSNKRPTGD